MEITSKIVFSRHVSAAVCRFLITKNTTIMEKRIGFGPRLGAFVIDMVFVWILAAIMSRVSSSWMAVQAQQQIDGIISSNPIFA